MHAVSRRYRKSGGPDANCRLEYSAAGRTFAGHGRCFDLRAGTGGTESDPLRGEIFSARARRQRLTMNAPVERSLQSETIAFTLNGKPVAGYIGETIIETAKRHGVDIPHLCYKEGMRPDGNCRACMVEIKGERVLAPSCCRQPAKDMDVQSTSARALASQKMVVELLMSDVPKDDLKPGANELFQWAGELGVLRSRFAPRHQPAADQSHPAMSVNLDACIQCTRCVRACREEQVNDVIGYALRGLDSNIAFYLADPMGE